MAEAVVSFGIQKLWELLNQESERLLGVHQQVADLKHNLRRLQFLLKDAYAKKHESERVRNFLEDVKDIVYDAEDIIEIFFLKEETLKGKRIMKHVRRFTSDLVDRRKIAWDIEGINKRISRVIEEMQRFGIQNIIDGGRSLSLEVRQREQKEMLEAFPRSSESNLVGVEPSAKELVGHLVENDNIQVVSISGMGGLGKTTLARQVFHHEMVRRHFDGFAWVSVSQQFTRKTVWQRILQDLRPHDGDILLMDEYRLQRKLYELLKTDKFFIVIDDIWKEADWDRIKAVFPHKGGWKILLTSRNEGVGLHADPTCFSFRPKNLTPEQSWTLCQRIAAVPWSDETEFRIDEELEVMGKKMVTYCGGLPLAIKVLGGLLAGKKTVSQWTRVYENIEREIVGTSANNLNSVFRVLSLSYEDLPMNLKHCFLYLAHFPEDYKIQAEILFSYWVADGIVVPYHDGTIQDSAECCLEELVRRNMIIAERDYTTLGFDYCLMHDIMRGFCLSKAYEENFLQIFKAPSATATITTQLPSRSRRLVVHSSNAFQTMEKRNNEKVRSLLFFEVNEDSKIQSSVPDLRSLPLLRVLDLSRVNFQGGKLPSSIGKLIHLRFLSLFEAGVSHLPYSLRNLKLLLHLNLGVAGDLVHVPNVLKEMLELRYLILPCSVHHETKLELGDLVNLETLMGYSAENSSVEDLFRMAKLRNLIVYSLDGFTFEALSKSFCELKNLHLFGIYEVMHGNFVATGEKLFLDFVHLKVLALSIRILRLPDQHRFPPHLAHIYLRFCYMVEDPMRVLGQLLHLKSVELSSYAYVGNLMVCGVGWFPQLGVLELKKQENLEHWIVLGASMPCLRTLTIHKCNKLKKLPEGIKLISSLKELRIVKMKKNWVERLSKGGEDYHKVEHIPLVNFFRCDEE